MTPTPAIAAAQRDLGVALPATYIEAFEDYGLAGVQAYRFYRIDELRWFRDHPLSKSISPKYESLVIAEDNEGNTLVYLAFPVAGRRTLSDEVYLVDHASGEMEEVAMDLLQLLQEQGEIAEPGSEPVAETAFEVGATPQRIAPALSEALEVRGYGPSPAVFDPRGEYLSVTILGDGPTAIWVRAGDILWLGRRLAGLLDQPVHAYSVVLRDEMVKSGNGDWEFPVTTRSVEIDPEGTMVDRDATFDADTANYGDPWETVSSVLWELLDDGSVDRGSLGRSETTEFYRPAPPDEISPRVATLLELIGEAVSVDLTEVAGQQAVRFELSDGSRQMSVVTDEELAALRTHADVEI